MFNCQIVEEREAIEDFVQQGVWQNAGGQNQCFSFLFFNSTTYPTGRYKFSQVQIINIKL